MRLQIDLELHIDPLVLRGMRAAVLAECENAASAHDPHVSERAHAWFDLRSLLNLVALKGKILHPEADWDEPRFVEF